MRISATCTILVIAIGFHSPAEALVINVNDLTGGTQNAALNAFNLAADLWEAELADNITINLDFNFAPLGAGILGGTGSDTAQANFANVRVALLADATSADDIVSAASLPAGPTLQFRTNDNTGAVILDNDGSGNNFALNVNRANLKALGLIGANDAARDASITFSSNFAFDLDRSNGIDGGLFDFVGIAAHEIGHALGFVSGVDTIDNNPATDLNAFRVHSVLDLFRYSADSLALGGPGTLDFAYDPHPGGRPYFSLDGGATALQPFETGRNNGTGQQASHWQDNLGIGALDPTAAPGELINITADDLRAFDVIGFDLNMAAAVPEPSSVAFLSVCVIGLGIMRRRKTAISETTAG